MHIFHSHGFVPAEHLLVSVLGLIFRGIPVKGIEHPRLRIWMTIHGKHMMDCARDWKAHQRHFTQQAAQMVEGRYGDLEYSVKRLRLHFVRKPSPEIAEAIPLV